MGCRYYCLESQAGFVSLAAENTESYCVTSKVIRYHYQPYHGPALTHARTHARTHTHTHKYTHACTHAHTDTHIQTHTDTHTRARTHSRTHTRTHAPTHARTHTHTYTRDCIAKDRECTNQTKLPYRSGEFQARNSLFQCKQKSLI